MKKMLLTLLVAGGLTACVSTPMGPLTGAELYGKTIRVDGPRVTTRTTFNRDGTAVTVQPDGRRVTARYWVEDGKLCFSPVGGTERDCWLYTRPLMERLVRGQTIDMTAPDGTPVRVTFE